MAERLLRRFSRRCDASQGAERSAIAAVRLESGSTSTLTRASRAFLRANLARDIAPPPKSELLTGTREIYDLLRAEERVCEQKAAMET